MSEKKKPTDKSLLGAEEIDLERDMRQALYVGALTILLFTLMIFASDPRSGVLQIPTLENGLMALAGALVAAAALVALRARLPVQSVAWAVLVAYTLIISLTVHFTGGPQTPMPALYLLVVVAASFLLGRRGAMFMALLSSASYAVILFFEYYGLLSMVLIWRQEFDPRQRGVLLAINWLAVAVPTFFTAELAGRLAERLRRTNAHLRQSERLRESLTQMIVHDLRNPLTALMGGVEVLHLTATARLDESQRRLLESARRSGRALVDLVDELLDVRRMEAGALTLEREEVDLGALCCESVETVSALADAEELTIAVDVDAAPLVVRCDRQLIGRVLANLLSNAIKYTPAGGQITLSAHRQGNDTALVSVADTGVGILPENQQAIFEVFGLVDQPGRRGTGLGLAFSKMVVEAHGGHIWVESQPERGSTFCFTLPVGFSTAEGAEIAEK